MPSFCILDSRVFGLMPKTSAAPSLPLTRHPVVFKKAKQGGERLWKRMIGKPYSGELNVRFDERELEIGPRHNASSLLYT
jgi:hypothetical protein